MAAPIPIALVQSNEDFARYFVEALRPEFEVVHVCLSAEAAVAELGIPTPLCPPHEFPAGGNALVPPPWRKAPRAVVVGLDIEPGTEDAIEAAIQPETADVPVVRAPGRDADDIRDVLRRFVADGTITVE
ncbi:uncharacterized protein B0H64DRAFT_377484 [Chaetomium fimeti]|uniref:Uncharacterized protein n=1 Tax=Chaetomium fimeti TaxID=1854472 RepID=A0AAE0H8P3_9PEZI|nr:hypothetical protein B0H64DRAFT_377484 [Chaetomium fimeti]